MPKSKKSRNAGSDYTASPTVNTLGIDIEPIIDKNDAMSKENVSMQTIDEMCQLSEDFELSDGELPDREEPQDLPEKIIKNATISLSVVLVGGSVVFWWVICKYLLSNPSMLVNANQMSAVLLMGAVVPVLVTLAQVLLKRPISIERWLINMFISGTMSALLVVGYQMIACGDEFTISELPALLCCTVSGCTLPSALFMGVRMALPYFLAWGKRITAPVKKEDWLEMSEELCRLNDLDGPEN